MIAPSGGFWPAGNSGGNGVSGQAFMDNKAFREYTFKTFEANVLDMETAAMAHVAYANSVPFIAFRSLSDLAGGGEGENEMGTFFKIAADNSAKVLLAFLSAWDEFFYALIFTSDLRAKTLPVAIADFAAGRATDYGLVSAVGVLAALPPTVFAVLFQRSLVSGLSAGSVKG